MNTKLEAVRQAIVKAVPGIEGECSNCKWGSLDSLPHKPTRIGRSYCHKEHLRPERPITLEDVLRAMKSNAQLMRWATIELRFEDGKVEFGYNDHADECSYMHWYEWTLGLPLDQQPEPFIDFLYDLLANTERV